MPRDRSRSRSRDRGRRGRYEGRHGGGGGGGGGGGSHRHRDRGRSFDEEEDRRRHGGHSSRHRDGRGRSGDDRRRDEESDENEVQQYVRDENCVRIGVEKPRNPLTKEELRDEIDSVRFGHRVVLTKVEGARDTFEWGSVYFKTPDEADQCITLLNIPGRMSKWRNYVTQRPPLPGPQSGEIGTLPSFVANVVDPADTMPVDTQEGYVAFSTDEVYRSRGSDDYITARRVGKTIRRLICKHFDPESHTECRYRADCQFVHVKAIAMNRLLRTAAHNEPLRATRNDEDIQVSLWEFARRHDTLVIRNPGAGLDDAGLRYMFENCKGYKESFMRRRDQRSYGIVRFHDDASAMAALLDTYGSNLNIGFYGTMEDIRNMQMHESKDPAAVAAAAAAAAAANVGPSGGGGHTTATSSSRGAAAPNGSDRHQQAGSSADPRGRAQGGASSEHGSASGTGASGAVKPAAVEVIPAAAADGASKDGEKFPPLPEGWHFSLSRRTGQYFFYRVNEKSKTVWKHPVTQQTYSA